MLPGAVAISRVDFWMNLAVVGAVWASGIVMAVHALYK